MEFSKQEYWTVAISFSMESSRPRDQIHVSCISRWILYDCTTWEAQTITYFYKQFYWHITTPFHLAVSGLYL